VYQNSISLGRVEGLMCRFQNHESGISRHSLNQLMAFGTFIFSYNLSFDIPTMIKAVIVVRAKG
jgi:hypothetical protein